MTLNTILILVAVSLSTLAGDYLIKLASDKPSGMATTGFVLGALFYGIPAFGWFFLMRAHSLAAIGVFYSSATLILLAAIGVLAFGEAFGVREALGIALALAAVVIMST